MGRRRTPSTVAFMDAVHAVLRDGPSATMTCRQVAQALGDPSGYVLYAKTYQALRHLFVDGRVREHRTIDGAGVWWSTWPDALDAADLEAMWILPAADRG